MAGRFTGVKPGGCPARYNTHGGFFTKSLAGYNDTLKGDTEISSKPRRLLNLGCGVNTSDLPGVVNIDWNIYLRIRKSFFYRFFVPVFIRGERREKLDNLPKNVLVHDLSRGIPFADADVDAVYHSHFLEHLDRDVAIQFINECKRVLRPGGILRISVPDFEQLTRRYIAHIDTCDSEESQRIEHDNYIDMLIGHCVRREVVSTSQQPPLRRFLENKILGSARKRGDTHQWMYDRHNLRHFLAYAGFDKIVIQTFDKSMIPNWVMYGLDQTIDGHEYKPDSLYVEARKPA